VLRPAYDLVMADLTAGPGPAADPGTGAPPDDGTRGPDWGLLLDTAGVLAAVLLIVIVADVWTDGRLISRRLPGWKEDPSDPAAD
jgi:hypothetical protein